MYDGLLDSLCDNELKNQVYCVYKNYNSEGGLSSYTVENRKYGIQRESTSVDKAINDIIIALKNSSQFKERVLYKF